ncbi:MAG: HEPN domain-containing protein [Alphaproteobacteria bacterium]|nr:MAG: HEPN domain-containing protein [Alphaproteobacteria bacterium]
MKPEISPYAQARIDSTIYKMFVSSADENYILARLAFHNCLHTDFLWLILHAIEKYLKAILLFNGQSVKNNKHDIKSLFERVIAIYEDIAVAEFNPVLIGQFWSKESFAQFIGRLNDRGCPDNRYMTYGYSIRGDELLKADQVIWTIRRYCRRPNQILRNEEGLSHILDWKEVLGKNQKKWELTQNQPIERIIRTRSPEQLYSAFIYLNVPFAPNYPHAVQNISLPQKESPFSYEIDRIASEQISMDDFNETCQFFDWAIDNMILAKDIKQEIQQTKKSYIEKSRKLEKKAV